MILNNMQDTQMKKRITTSLRDDLIKKLKRLCIDRDMRFNSLLEEAIIDYLKKANASKTKKI